MKFSVSAITEPLLDQDEVARLINSAPSTGSPPGAAQQGRAGEQTAGLRGSGSEFDEYRSYHPGDELRHIDWRATARARVTLLRTYQAELSRPVCLLIDRRSSMRYGTRVRLKVTQAARLLLWLAGREVRAGRELCALVADDPLHWIAPRRGMRGLDHLVSLVIAPCPPREPDPSEPSWGLILAGLRQRLARGSKLVIVSDFMGLGAEDAALLRATGRYFDTVAVRITDPSERQFSTRADLQLRWGCQARHLQRSSAAKALSRELQLWSETMTERLRTAGISVHELSVDQDDITGIGMAVL